MKTHITIPPDRIAREAHLSELTMPKPYPFSTRPTVVAAGTWTHIWLDNDRLAISYHEQYRGLTKNGKRFSRIQQRGRVTFAGLGNRMRVYSSGIANRRRQVRDVTAGFPGAWMGSAVLSDRSLTPHLLERSAWTVEIPSQFARNSRPRAVRPRAGLNQFLWQRIAYPILREAPHWDAVTGMSQPLRQARDLQDFTRLLFGDSRYRKDLVKAVAAAPRLDGVWLARELRTLFPTDWLIPLIGGPLIRKTGLHPIKPFMRWLPEYAARRLLREWGEAGDSYGIDDTLLSWRAILREKPDYTLGAYRVTTWGDLHDHLARELRKVERADKPIEPTRIAKRLDGKSMDGITLVHPRSTHELIDWGNAMHNCIGGYDRKALQGSSVLFAVMRDGDLIGNMELRPSGSIRQLVGDYNRPLDEAVRATVVSMVTGQPVAETMNATEPEDALEAWF